MNVIQTIIYVTSKVFTLSVFIITMYYLCISFFGLWRNKEDNIYKPSKTFALIVAAHNEEKVIQDVVVSLKKLDYPKELYDIYVIADNCDDKTAIKAKAKGAIVYKRFNKEKRGKGYALDWMFNKIFEMDKKYDAVAVFDADNLVSKNFLIEMNQKLCEGHKVIQGYLDSKNPKDNWITGAYSISFWTSNRMFQLSRHNLGLSNQLGGTGFCIDTYVLKEIGWGATCLTEDLEFTCKLVLNDYKVTWAHNAIVYDEKPLTLSQSWRQRKRWMQGFSDVSGRYFFKLLKKSIKEFNFAAFDCALYSIQPIVILLLGLSMVVSGVQYSVTAVNELYQFNTGIYSFNITMAKIATTIIGILQFIYTPLILVLDDKLDWKIFWYYIIYPIYAATWIPISLKGMMDKDNKEWDHTEHTRSISIDELEEAN